jgi:alpha-beta hydrolase superfamily lysophospholipase
VGPIDIDYTPFDHPAVSSVMFHPQAVWTPPPVGAVDRLIPVADGVSISARLYVRDKQSPMVLFFHGNGEVACHYDDIAPKYIEAGVNFFAADFRGYGASGGVPSFSTMMADALVVFDHMAQQLEVDGYEGPLFVKGRSLGAYSAVEIAMTYPERVRGLIIESGAANVARMASRWGLEVDVSPLSEMIQAYEDRLSSISLPLLVIHGEADELIPLQFAIDFYDSVATKDKSIEIIPGAGHNDLLWIGIDQYFQAIRDFVAGH